MSLPKRIAARYDVLRQLGRGSTATVYLAEDRRRNGCKVALKLMHGGASAEWLISEHEVLASLEHPNLARVLDIDVRGEPAFLSCEVVEGPDLATWSRGQSPEAVVRSLAGILRALCLLHARGWVHGDLKPTNILVDGATAEAKLVDLGLARRGGGQTGGTAGYAAPEILTGGVATTRSDVYALGVVLLEALAGRRAFGDDAKVAVSRQMAEASVLADVSDDLPSGLRELIARLLAVDAERRPADAADALQQLRAALPAWDLSADVTKLAALAQGPLVGREAATALIDEALQRVASGGGPRTVAFEGARGLGKSRLVAETRLRAARQGYECVEADTVRLALAQLASILREDAGLQRPLAALLAGLLPGVAATSAVAAADLATRLRDGLFELAIAVARRGALVLLFDDLDRLDQLEQDAVSSLAGAMQDEHPDTVGLPLLLVLTSGEGLAHLPGESTALEPLGREHGIALARSVLPGVPVAEEVAARAWEMGAGNPWLIRESLTTWVRTGQSLLQLDGATDGASDLPDPVLAFARERLRIAGRLRDALSVLALAPDLDARALLQLAPLEPRSLQRLVAEHLVVERPGEDGSLRLALGGEHLRQVLLAEIAEADRSARQARIASVLEQLDERPDRVALHWQGAGEPRRAADRYLLAARQGFDYRGSWASRAAALGGRQWGDGARPSVWLPGPWRWPESRARRPRTCVTWAMAPASRTGCSSGSCSCGCGSPERRSKRWADPKGATRAPRRWMSARARTCCSAISTRPRRAAAGCRSARRAATSRGWWPSRAGSWSWRSSGWVEPRSSGDQASLDDSPRSPLLASMTHRTAPGRALPCRLAARSRISRT